MHRAEKRNVKFIERKCKRWEEIKENFSSPCRAVFLTVQVRRGGTPALGGEQGLEGDGALGRFGARARRSLWCLAGDDRVWEGKRGPVSWPSLILGKEEGNIKLETVNRQISPGSLRSFHFSSYSGIPNASMLVWIKTHKTTLHLSGCSWGRESWVKRGHCLCACSQSSFRHLLPDFFSYYLSSPLEQRLRQGRDDLLRSPSHVRHRDSAWPEGCSLRNDGVNKRMNEHHVPPSVNSSLEGFVCNYRICEATQPRTELLPFQLAHESLQIVSNLKRFELYLFIYESLLWLGTSDGRWGKTTHPTLPLKPFFLPRPGQVGISPFSLLSTFWLNRHMHVHTLFNQYPPWSFTSFPLPPGASLSSLSPLTHALPR